MKPLDLITLVGLVIGFFLVIVMYVLLKRKKSRARALPRVLGIGAWTYASVSMMTTSILLRPKSDFMDYTITNIVLSLALGIIGYIGGRGFAHNMPD